MVLNCKHLYAHRVFLCLRLLNDNVFRPRQLDVTRDWVRCEVMSYDEEIKTYTVRWSDDKEIKNDVLRLELLFNVTLAYFVKYTGRSGLDGCV